MRYCYYKTVRREKKPGVIIFSVISLIAGTLTLLWAFYPIVVYQISELLTFDKEVSPLPKSVMASALEKGMGSYNEDSIPYYSSYLKDFTKVANWFPKKPQEITHHSPITEYYLTISKIGVNKALVKIGSTDLGKSLIQYSDAVVPGETGNIVVLGHSTLPQLYKEQDYKSIFTYLPSLEKNDLIKLTVKGFEYQYSVYDTFVVDPADVWVLDHKADKATLTLISCVPPGTYWKRLIVKAKLVEL